MTIVRLLREERQRGPDQGVGLAQRLRGRLDVFAERDVARPCHQKPKGHSLGIAVREFLVVSLWKEELAPVCLEARQSRLAASELFFDLLAQ